MVTSTISNRLLTESGTIVAKFYLHISKDEPGRSGCGIGERRRSRRRGSCRAGRLGSSERSWDEYIDDLRRCPLNYCFHCLCPMVRCPRRTTSGFATWR